MAEGDMRQRLAAQAFHLVCRRDSSQESALENEETFAAGFTDTERFFGRLPDGLDLRGLSVLDFGCGLGSTCVWVAERGAARVVGVDIQSLELPRRKLAQRRPELRERIELREIAPNCEIGAERFDLVISKNAMEHVADPDAYVAAMAKALRPGGLLALGFAPLWKSPTGGHIGYMTPLPWAHMIFPESVIMAERRRFRPEENARHFEDFKGGLNRMTLDRFERTMARSGLEPVAVCTNQGRGARSRKRRVALRAMSLAARVPALLEYSTFSVHGIWRVPAEGGAGAR